jgi:hypothetical protein
MDAGNLRCWFGQSRLLRATGGCKPDGHACRRWHDRGPGRKARATSIPHWHKRDGSRHRALTQVSGFQNLARRGDQIWPHERGFRAELPAAGWSVHRRWFGRPRWARWIIRPWFLLALSGVHPGRTRAVEARCQSRLSRLPGQALRQCGHAPHCCNSPIANVDGPGCDCGRQWFRRTEPLSIHRTHLGGAIVQTWVAADLQLSPRCPPFEASP